jgi:molybdopterin-containing oxidoreductase family membrane subunit
MAMRTDPGILAVFAYLDDLLRALEALKGAGIKVHTVFSPTPSHEIQEALGARTSPVRYFTLLGGLAGFTGGIGLGTFTIAQWNFITGGKPLLPWVPFVVVGFEMTILLGFLSTLVGMLLNNRMPRLRLPDGYDPRFSHDRFGILVGCPRSGWAEVSRLLREAGAEEVREIHG